MESCLKFLWKLYNRSFGLNNFWIESILDNYCDWGWHLHCLWWSIISYLLYTSIVPYLFGAFFYTIIIHIEIIAVELWMWKCWIHILRVYSFGSYACYIVIKYHSSLIFNVLGYPYWLSWRIIICGAQRFLYTWYISICFNHFLISFCKIIDSYR